MAPKKCKDYKELCLKEKVELLKFLETNSQRRAAEKYQISKTCVNNILKRKLEYVQRYEENENELQCRKIRKTNNIDINQATLEWFKKMRGINARISGPMLQEVALDFAKKFGVEGFTASNGWLESFKKRHKISEKILCGESNDIDSEIVENYMEKIPYLIEKYKMEDIFNADECGLFYRAMPNKSLVAAGDKCKDGKISKERVSVLLSCSASGEKLKPLVIGKAKKPRCFRDVNVKNLPVMWYANKKAWMTGDIFSEWLHLINKQMKQKNRNILLIVDNCRAHPQDMLFSNLKVHFLPANTTSCLQPLDQGIIQSFKLHYKKFLLQAVIARSDGCKSANEIASCINVLDSIMWIKESWEMVSSTTIFKCFAKCGFVQKTSDNMTDDISLDSTLYADSISDVQDLIEKLNSNENDMISAEKFLEIENDIQTSENYFDSESVKNDILENKRNEEEDIQEDEEEHENMDTPSDTEMLQMCKRMQLYALEKCADILTPLRKIEKLTEIVIIEKKALHKKQLLTIFLKAICNTF